MPVPPAAARPAPPVPGRHAGRPTPPEHGRTYTNSQFGGIARIHAPDTPEESVEKARRRANDLVGPDGSAPAGHRTRFTGPVSRGRGTGDTNATSGG